MKSRHIDQKNPGRSLIQASGTPITNTLGEMYSLLRFQAPDALAERGVHEFDAWASAFGDTRTELELSLPAPTSRSSDSPSLSTSPS